MVTYSATITIRKDRKGSNGKSAVYMLFRAGAKKSKIFLDIEVDPVKWDDSARRLKGRGDEVANINSLLDQKAGLAAKIISRYRMQETAENREGLLTPIKFKLEMMGKVYRDDFISFAHKAHKERQAFIKPSSWRGMKSRLEKFQEFIDYLPFHEFNADVLEKYNMWLKKKKGNTINTREAALKTVQTYVHLAIKAGYDFNNPFSHFKIKGGHTHREVLSVGEVKLLLAYYRSGAIRESHWVVLDRFLFACFTGLRHGDLNSVHSDMIINGELRFMAEKTNELNKTNIIPLNALALEIINGRQGRLFPQRTLTTVNEHLKDIAQICGINKNITSHVARHTFATVFLELGGSVEVLKQLMGHSDLKTTMIYVHISKQRMHKEVKVFESAFSPTLAQL